MMMVKNRIGYILKKRLTAYSRKAVCPFVKERAKTKPLSTKNSITADLPAMWSFISVYTPAFEKEVSASLTLWGLNAYTLSGIIDAK